MTVAFPITTVVYDNADLLPRILALYGKPGMTIADVTYGSGVFWQKVDLGQYTIIKSDLNPRAENVIKADCRDLAFLGIGNVSMIVLDPPYMAGVKVREGYNSSYGVNEANVRYDGVIDLYAKAIHEASIALAKGGLLCIKTADLVESGVNHFAHIEIYSYACGMGFEPLDLFVYVQSREPRMRHKHQQHARKQHSYMWVFRYHG